MKLLGVTDEITVCDLCGKKNLKCTVALETEDGQIVHYGRDCAGMAVFGRKSRKNNELAELKARARSRVEPVVKAVRESLHLGVEAAVAAGRGATDKNGFVWWTDHVRGEYCDIRVGGEPTGMQVSVSGFRSWGNIVVNYCGGREEIPL